MSSNESVERMLKQLENLLRQQDRDQSREAEAGNATAAADGGPPTPAADGGPPTPAAEQVAVEPNPAPVVEVVDTIEPEAMVEEAPEPERDAAVEPAPAGVPGAQGLHVETVPSEEDWYEVGGSAQAGAEGKAEPVLVDNEIDVDAASGPGLDSHDALETLAVEAAAGTQVQDAAGEDESREAELAPGGDGQPIDRTDEPTEISAEVPVEVLDSGHEAEEPALAMSASASSDAAVPEKLSSPAENLDMQAEAGTISLGEAVADESQSSADLGPDGETTDEEATPTSKYPSWWFRGGTVHQTDGADGPEASNGAGDIGVSDDQVSAGPRSDETDGTTVGRPDVEPFVHREPVVGPPPVRKMISEQLQEEELVAQQQEEELAEARSEVVIGIEGIEAVPGPSDALPGEDPEVVAVVEEAAEPEADPAGALKIVESLTEAVAPEKVDSSQQDSTVEEVEIPEEIPEESPDEVAREVAHTETTATSEIGFAALPSESREEAIDQIEEIVDEVVDEAVDEAVAEAVVEAVVEQAPEVAEPQVEVLQSEVQEVVEVEEVELATSPEAPVLVAETGSERPRRRLTARLGTLLLDAHLISGRDLDRALEEHQVSGERLGHYLVDKGMVDEKDLAAVLSDQYGVPAADVETAAVPAAALMCVPEKMARRYMVLPLGVNEGTIDLAMVNPSDIDAIKDIEFTTGLRVQPLIATDWAIERAIERLYSGEELRTARLSGGSSSSTGLKDPKAIIRRMVRDRDEAVLQSEQDPQSAYELAASIDEFVDEILKVVKQLQK